jgi:citrate synthase
MTRLKNEKAIEMTAFDELLNSEDILITDMGGWFQGERVVLRGKDLFTEFANASWIEVLLFGITGRRFTSNQIKLFNGVWNISASYPDPRIWNNRIVALAGTARSTAALAIGAATAVSEATIYGRGPDIRSIDFLLRTKAKLDAGQDLGTIIKKELKLRRVIAGYGRPVINKDERINPLEKLAKSLGLFDGAYVKLAYDVENYLIKGRYRMKMNVASLIASLCADQGLTAQEYYKYTVLCFSAGMFPCYIDAVNKPEGSFFPLRCERINYTGVAKRQWKGKN